MSRRQPWRMVGVVLVVVGLSLAAAGSEVVGGLVVCVGVAVLVGVDAVIR